MSRIHISISLNTTHICLLLGTVLLSGCGRSPNYVMDTAPPSVPYVYTIAPGDLLDVFVWRNAEVSAVNVPVMPDGRISTPMVEEIVASGKTPVQLANDIEKVLSKVIADPYVTVTVRNFEGSYSQQVRVVGEAAEPSAIPYRNDMSLLDVIIAVGGLTEFAAGNRATIVRNIDGKPSNFKVRLEDLIKRGDLSANTRVAPGDILIIPESLF